MALLDVHVVAPTRCKVVQDLRPRLQVVVQIALEIHGADVDEKVHSLELRKLLDHDERHGHEVVRIQKGEVKSVLVQRFHYIVYNVTRLADKCVDRGAARHEARVRRFHEVTFPIRDVEVGELVFELGSRRERDNRAPIDELARLDDPAAPGTTVEIDVRGTREPTARAVRRVDVLAQSLVLVERPQADVQHRQAIAWIGQAHAHASATRAARLLYIRSVVEPPCSIQRTWYRLRRHRAIKFSRESQEV